MQMVFQNELVRHNALHGRESISPSPNTYIYICWSGDTKHIQFLFHSYFYSWGWNCLHKFSKPLVHRFSCDSLRLASLPACNCLVHLWKNWAIKDQWVLKKRGWLSEHFADTGCLSSGEDWKAINMNFLFSQSVLQVQSLCTHHPVS